MASVASAYARASASVPVWWRAMLGTVRSGNLPGVEPMVRHLGGAVQEVGQVGGGEAGRVVGGHELGGHPPPAPLRDVDGQFHGTGLLPPGPYEGGRHVQVGVAPVDAGVGPVGPVSVERVAERDRAAVLRDRPLVGVRPVDRHLPAVHARGTDVVDVLGELVERVPSRRRPAHPDLQRSGGQIRPDDRDLGLVVCTVRERDLVADGCLGGHGGRTQDQQSREAKEQQAHGVRRRRERRPCRPRGASS